jgi:hypothetical protein
MLYLQCPDFPLALLPILRFTSALSSPPPRLLHFSQAVFDDTRKRQAVLESMATLETGEA